LTCKQILPIYDFYPKDHTGRPFAHCKRCQSHDRDRYDRQLRQARLALRGLRECFACRKVLWIGHFNSKPDGRPHSSCKACSYAYQKARYQADPRAVRRYQNWYNAAHREKVNAQARARYAAHPERVKAGYERHKLARAALNKTWRRKNHAHITQRTHERRALIKGNGGSWTAFAWERLKAQCDWTCVLCGKREPDVTLTFDHIVPVTMGGFNLISNGQPCCAACNVRKHARFRDVRPAHVRWWPLLP
jgi:hypothetical protein